MMRAGRGWAWRSTRAGAHDVEMMRSTCFYDATSLRTTRSHQSVKECEGKLLQGKGHVKPSFFKEYDM